MYLFIDENGDVTQGIEITERNKKGVEEGILQIFKFDSDLNQFMDYNIVEEFTWCSVEFR